MVGGLLVRLFYGVGRASCGAARYFHSCRGCGLGRTNSFFGGSFINYRIDLMSLLVFLLQMAYRWPYPLVLAGCLSGISVGQDWACSWRGSRIVVCGASAPSLVHWWVTVSTQAVYVWLCGGLWFG